MASPHFEHRKAYKEFLSQNGVFSATDQYVSKITQLAKSLRRLIGPKELSSEADVQRLMDEWRATDPIFESFNAFNRRQQTPAALRKYVEMVQSNFAELFQPPHEVKNEKPLESLSKDLPILAPYTGPGTKARRVARSQRERPAQAVFRQTLKLAYGSACCITGCTITEVLEGAHIDGYEGHGSDHPQNGLLLRIDLHRLFDRGLIAIDPTSRTVYVAEQIRRWPEYAAMHGTPLREPIAGGPSYRPALIALEKRWRAFLKKHKLPAAAGGRGQADFC